MPPSRQRLRVLIVGPSLDILGGQAVQAMRLFAGLQKSTAVVVEFLAINPRFPRGLAALHRVKYIRTIVNTMIYGCRLFRRVPAADVVHAFSASYYSYILSPLPALAIARLFRKRTLLNYRSGEAEDHLANWPLSLWTMKKLADLVVVPSAYLATVFAKHGLHTVAIANFVPVESLPYRRRLKLRPIILSNRNLETLYNLPCTLRAFQLVQQRHADAELIVAGDGSQRDSLELLARQLGLRHTQFVGKVTNVAMAELYDRCDIYVNTPDIDNMPGSILEAFACGLAVVTSNAGGIPYIVEDGANGLLTPCGDPVSVADAICKLLENDDLAQRLTCAAREQCLSRYIWERVQAEWESVYRRLCGHG